MKQVAGGLPPGRGYRAAVAELVAAQKPGHGVPAYLRWVNRGLGRRLAAVSYQIGLSPNTLTLVSGILSLLGILILAIAPPTVFNAVVAVILLLAGYAFDSADGQLARLTAAGSVSGEWLDHVVDAARLPALHLAIAVGLFVRVDVATEWPSLVALLFMLVSSVWFFGQILADKLSVQDRAAPKSTSGNLISIAKLPYDVGFLYLLLLFYPWVTAFITLYTAQFLLTLFVATISLIRKYQALAPSRPGSDVP